MKHWIFEKVKCMLGMHDLKKRYVVKFDEDWVVEEYCRREGCYYITSRKIKVLSLSNINRHDP